MTKEVLILGAGPIAVEYFKIAKDLGHSPVVIGRSAKSAEWFKEQTGTTAVTGLLKENLRKYSKDIPVIVAVSEDQLGIAVKCLLELSFSRIFVEKPGSATPEELEDIYQLASSKKSKIFVGYNRRYYQSVLEMQKRIEADGGLTSFCFEFTEWSHVIEGIKKNPGVKENWLWQNSSHVIDLAFHIGGQPKQLSTFKTGSLSWHPQGSKFTGAGITDKGAVFSYHANWEGPGRWWAEFVTNKNRYVLKPLEELRVQVKGSVAVDPVSIESDLDKKWKPGFYLQTSSFLNEQDNELMSLEEQKKKLEIYLKILNGTST